MRVGVGSDGGRGHGRRRLGSGLHRAYLAGSGRTATGGSPGLPNGNVSGPGRPDLAAAVVLAPAPALVSPLSRRAFLLLPRRVGRPVLVVVPQALR